MLIELPTLPVLFQKVVWTLDIPQQTNRSAFTSRTQTIGTPGVERWLATAHALPAASAAEARAWRAFLAAARGSENTFHQPALAMSQHPNLGPLVTAAVAGNRAVTVDSVVDIALGMYATVQQVDGHHRLGVVVGLDGLDVHLEPGLSAAPIVPSTLVIGEPYARVQLVRPDQALPNIWEPFTCDVEEKL